MYNESNRKVYITIVFFVSLLIFILSLFPGAYFVSTVDLSGTAGDSGTPPTPSTNDPINLSVFDNGVSIISGMVSILSAVYGITLTRSEFAKLKAAQIDREMQMQEIEKLRLELELEKRKEAKRKERSNKQKIISKRRK